MKILVFDPGYGDVKYALVETETGEISTGKFPTLITEAKRGVDFENEESGLFWAGKEYLVGKEAAFLGRTLDPTTDNFLETYIPLLLAKTLLDIGQERVDKVIIAVSLYDWPRRKAIEKSAKQVVLKDHKFEHEVLMVPQGYGIWFDNLAPKDGIVIDIGFRTVDVLSLDEEGKPEGKFSFGIADLGVKYFVDDVANLLSEEAKDKFTAGEIMYFLQKKRSILRRLGIEKEIEVRIDGWLTLLWNTLLTKKNFRRAVFLKEDRVVVAGGGALFFREPEDGFCRMTIIKESPEFANVRGIAKWILQEAQR